jgi:pyruvate formate lyase activating enzyme
VDLVLLDIKEIISEKHEEFTGVPNTLILENAIWISNYVKENGKKLWIRTPIIPNYTATEENIKGIGEFIVIKLHNIPERWDLLSFNNLCTAKYERLDMDWYLKDLPLISSDEMDKFTDIGKKVGVSNVKWSGLTKKEENPEPNN